MKTGPIELSLQEVLFLIGMQEQTGELELESGNNMGSMLFYQGTILHASSPYSRAIGDLLVDDGIISEADLIETLELQKKNRDIPVGILLLKAGKITFEIIEMMVQEQIRIAVREFQSWGNINYNFTSSEIKPFDRINVPVHEFIEPTVLQSAAKFLSLPSHTSL